MSLPRAGLCGIAAMVGLLLVSACARSSTADGQATIAFKKIREVPHDTNAFTQGLLVHEGVFYESTGLYGRSSLRKVEIDTGTVLLQRDLPAGVFGEGLALLDGKFYQLTWREHVVLVYDAATMEPKARFPIVGEGWGLAAHKGELIVSDGTSRLRFYDPATMTQRRGLTVTENGKPLGMLNELEIVGDNLYANIWGEDFIVRIDPATGRVTGRMDASSLVPRGYEGRSDAVLNGIAYDPESDRLYVTGKWWPVIYELDVENDS